MSERELREQIVMHGKSLFDRGCTSGSSGNISVRLPDGILVTPTNSCLGRLDPDRIAKVAWDGTHLSGDKPSKEATLHLSVYRSREQDSAIVHLHSTYSVAVSCMEGIDAANVLPPLTAYYVMRVGRLPLLPYFAPGDQKLAATVERHSRDNKAVLLANHGPIVAGSELDSAIYAMEELEETAKLFLLLHDKQPRYLTPRQVRDLEKLFPS